MVNSIIFTPTIPKAKNSVVVWSGLSGCADALTLASAINNSQNLFVVITPDSQTALRLELDCISPIWKLYLTMFLAHSLKLSQNA